jgi:Flp pilus assembly protein CpaB
MQRRLITVIIFAVVAALASSTVLYRVIEANSAHASASVTSQIFVASRDLSAGTVVTESDIRQVKWPGAVNPLWAARRDDIVGRGLSTAVNSGEPFAGNRVAPKGSSVTFASGIPPGMRIVPVHLDDQSGLSRLIIAGMHVDVLSTGVPAGQAGSSVTTRTILQNIKVLSTDQGSDRNIKEKLISVQSANLLVTPEQAEILSQAISQARIQLVLRNPLDMSSLVETAKEVDKPAPGLFHAVRLPAPEKKMDRPEAPPPPPPPPPTIEIVQGTKRTVTVVAASAGQEGRQ